MITCPKCSKENQDHYKFCLGCGAELPRGSGAPKPFSTQTPPQGVPAGRPPEPAVPSAQPAYPSRPAPMAATGGAIGAAGAAAAATPSAPPQRAPAPAPAPAAQAGGEIECPQCGHKNPAGFKFCASCGYNLSALRGGGSVPAAAREPAAPAASSGAPAQAAAAPYRAEPGTPVTLVALRADGTEAGSYRMPDAPTVTLGRDTGSIFAGDSYLSPRHATFTRRGRELVVKDEGSLNGVYLKLRPNDPWPLEYSDIFRIGQEIIRFEALKPQPASPDGVERFGSPARGYIGRLALVIGRDTTGNAFPVPERGVHCGRERGDILFSEDGYVSGLHCRIAKGSDGRVHLTDVGSSNGTFIRLRAERTLQSGDILLMGQQLFRVDF